MTEIVLTGTLSRKSNNQPKVKTVTLEALWVNRLHCFPRPNENSTSGHPQLIDWCIAI